jgi:phosphohistidine phosphatase SixA
VWRRGLCRGLILWGLLLALMPCSALAEADWDALRRPGAIAVMRHALAPGTGDPANFTLGDCATQRNLDEAGRAQARAIGEALRERGLGFDRVLTSQWCRCRETAELLALAPVEDFPTLNSFFRDRSGAEAQTRETRAFLAALPEDQRVLLVTHQVNITALTGRHAASGEILVIEVAEGGEIEVLGEILVEP